MPSSGASGAAAPTNPTPTPTPTPNPDPNPSLTLTLTLTLTPTLTRRGGAYRVLPYFLAKSLSDGVAIPALQPYVIEAATLRDRGCNPT